MRGRGVVPGVLLGAASSLVIGGVAEAADGSEAALVSLEAPVGIGAVAFGVIGLVAGLVRRRRVAVVRAASEQPAVETAVAGADPIEVRPATTGV
ncbi:hypothetical protein F4560_005819 [Saccharothrix ecbatanensis]|uniref:Uncharacterized protein n=1 Tax=Saccharothrix ecbatanensis TaxID=1105145 RepID=A0A7W9M3H9_9PSEU|nr:hypothetical protein [Saccharothrix ecbatanensis]MBB5806051.1 hypothetical protein [Saccharothrix ecbatanensis]